MDLVEVCKKLVAEQQLIDDKLKDQLINLSRSRLKVSPCDLSSRGPEQIYDTPDSGFIIMDMVREDPRFANRAIRRQGDVNPAVFASIEYLQQNLGVFPSVIKIKEFVRRATPIIEVEPEVLYGWIDNFIARQLEIGDLVSNLDANAVPILSFPQ